MKRLLVIALFLSVAVILSQEHKPQVAAQTDQTGTLRKLLIERRDTLRTIEESVAAAWKGGRSDHTEFLKAIMDRLEAELELGGSKEARIAMLNEALEKTKAIEDRLRLLLEKKRASPMEVFRVKAARLRIQIAIERAKKTD